MSDRAPVEVVLKWEDGSRYHSARVEFDHKFASEHEIFVRRTHENVTFRLNAAVSTPLYREFVAQRENKKVND